MVNEEQSESLKKTLFVKIIIEPYNPDWTKVFGRLKADLLQHIGFVRPRIDHIGSTSVQGLSAKPIIDILIGLEGEQDLDIIIQPLIKAGYIYYEVYNLYMPYRRFFVKHQLAPLHLSLPVYIRQETEIPDPETEHRHRLAHIHAIPVGSGHWHRHIAFRDYLQNHPEVLQAYQLLKKSLSVFDWKDGNEYNEAKNDFIKREEQKAVDWYIKRSS